MPWALSGVEGRPGVMVSRADLGVCWSGRVGGGVYGDKCGGWGLVWWFGLSGGWAGSGGSGPG